MEFVLDGAMAAVAVMLLDVQVVEVLAPALLHMEEVERCSAPKVGNGAPFSAASFSFAIQTTS